MRGFESKKKLANSLIKLVKTKPIDKVSIEEIVKNCGMSRQVFYKYFVDKYDLVHWIYDQDSLPGDDLYNSSKDYTDYSRHTLKVFIENENFYKNALSDIQSQNAFFKHWFKNGKARMMFNIGKSNINDEVDIAMDVYIYGTLFVVLNWLFSDQKKNQEVLARLLIKSMPSILKKYLLVK